MHLRPPRAHAQVPRRPHVGTLELEHQEHLRRPDADPAHARETRDRLFVVRVVDVVEPDDAVPRFG
ncbi:MAG TPA: hypothetical protein VMK30_04165, partial [Pleomorphomonadaceae bacterium]|nr:hypothetical protein [Pleomorphomonadaceae bacterium]